MVELPLGKWGRAKAGSKVKKNNHGGNSGKTGMGKHAAHPDVPNFRRGGYRVEPKWNVHAREDDQKWQLGQR